MIVGMWTVQPPSSSEHDDIKQLRISFAKLRIGFIRFSITPGSVLFGSD